jgi:hypothetical protein
MNKIVQPGPYFGQMLAATSALVDILKGGQPGDIATDVQLSVCGRNCSQEDGRRCVRSAIKHVERVHGVVWRRLRDDGAIKCLHPMECVEVVKSTRKHIGRTTRRAVQVLSTIQDKDVSPAELPSVMALAAQMGTLAMFSGVSVQKALEGRGIAEALDTRSLLSAFKK